MMSVKGGGGASSSADLLVCFPPHLTLMPKRIQSSSTRGGGHHRRGNSAGGGHYLKASPVVLRREMTKKMSLDTSEPTSPKVTCAGQQRNKRSSSSWTGSLGFLACLRNLRFDLRCFGSFPQSSEINSDDEDAIEEAEEEEEEDVAASSNDSRTVFSKWSFMVLQDEKEINRTTSNEGDVDSAVPGVIPPSNALLLMRCRSAPLAKTFRQQNQQEEVKINEEKKEEEEEEKIRKKNLKVLMEEEKKGEMDRSVVMRYETGEDDCYKIMSTEIAKETWVVAGGHSTTTNALSRSRSWK
ncbi:hypothetical protein LINPERHAP2_LOCUS28988 [Linum perenne]